METKPEEATLAAAAAAEEDALRLKRRNRLMQEKVALYKFEKEKCAGHEAEIRTLPRGDGRTNPKSVGISGGSRGGGGRASCQPLQQRGVASPTGQGVGGGANAA